MCEKKVKKSVSETAMHQSAAEGAGCLLIPVSSLHMSVFVLRKFHAARLLMAQFGGLWLRVTIVARVWVSVRRMLIFFFKD